MTRGSCVSPGNPELSLSGLPTQGYQEWSQEPALVSPRFIRRFRAWEIHLSSTSFPCLTTPSAACLCTCIRVLCSHLPVEQP